MSLPSSTPIPAGWYPDPAGSFQQRWWTGESWTNDFAQYRPTLIHAAPGEAYRSPVVSAPLPVDVPAAAHQQTAASATVSAQQAGQQASSSWPTQTLTREQPATVDPLPAFRLPDADQPPQTSVAQPNAGSATLIPVAPSYRPARVDTTFTNEYQPFGSVTEVRRGHRLRPERRYTAAAWSLALLPIALGAAAYALATLIPVLYTTFSQVLLLVVFLIASLVLAAVDRRILYRDGHDSTAHPAVALLTPLAYLVARSVVAGRETGRNAMGTLLLLLLVAAGIAAALIVVPGLLQLLVTASALY